MGAFGQLVEGRVRTEVVGRGRATGRPQPAVGPPMLHRARLTPAGVLALQRSVGNAAVGRLLRGLDVQRLVEYDGEKYDEETMALTDLFKLAQRVEKDETLEQGRREELTKTLRGAYDRRARTEGPRRPGRKTLPPVPQKPPKVVTTAVGHGTKPLPFDSVPVTAQNRDDVVRTLKEWFAYADAAEKRLSQAFADVREARLLLGDAYYDDANAEFRSKYKTLATTMVHLGGAKNEADGLADSIVGESEKGLHQFLALSRAGRIVAVAEWVGTYIANIAGDPRNIVPEAGKERPGGGVANAVIAITVLKARRRASKGQGAEITLYALNNKVKGVYARYGFKVLAADARKLDRPARGQKTIGAGGMRKPLKTEWHEGPNMVLPADEAVKFLDGLTEVVNPPEKLKEHLTQKT